MDHLKFPLPFLAINVILRWIFCYKGIFFYYYYLLLHRVAVYLNIYIVTASVRALKTAQLPTSPPL